MNILRIWFLSLAILFSFIAQQAQAELKVYVHNATASYGKAISIEAARITAIVKAKQLALELAGTYIDSIVVLDKGIVDKHQIRAIAAGTASADIIDEKINTDSITVTAKIGVDTSMLQKRVDRMLEDRTLLKKMQLLLHKEDTYLTEIRELEERNKALSAVTDQKSSTLTREIEISTKELEALQKNKSSLQALLNKLGNPKLMVSIKEKYVNFDQPDVQSASATLSSLLKNQGFDLTAAPADKKPREAAVLLGVEYVITGQAVVRDAGEIVPDTGMHSFQAVLQIEIMHAQTGRILGTKTKQAAAVHISPLSGSAQAVQKASKELLQEYVVDVIWKSFKEYLHNGIPIHLTVLGVQKFKHYKQINAMLEQLPEIMSSKKQSWDKNSNRLVLEIRTSDSTDELAELLDEACIPAGRLEVENITPAQLDLHFNPDKVSRVQ